MCFLPKPSQCFYLPLTQSMAALYFHLSVQNFTNICILRPSLPIPSCDLPGNFTSHHTLPCCITEWGVFYLSGPHLSHHYTTSFFLCPLTFLFFPLGWPYTIQSDYTASFRSTISYQSEWNGIADSTKCILYISTCQKKMETIICHCSCVNTSISLFQAQFTSSESTWLFACFSLNMNRECPTHDKCVHFAKYISHFCKQKNVCLFLSLGYN